MKILVTGGAGFIGSHLCEALLRLEHHITSVDNFNDFYDVGIKKQNIRDVQDVGNDRFVSVNADIRDRNAMETVFKEGAFDVIVHLAAMAGVRPSIQDPLLYESVNIRGTNELLDLARLHKIGSFVFASSSSVYGNNKKVPFAEQDPVDHPISPYAATKKAGELLCHTYHHLYNMNIAALRFFTVYGPRQRPDLAIHKFTRLIHQGEQIPFFGDGSTQRDYTYIDDIIDGVIKAICWVNDGEGKPKYDVFNLGESRTIALTEMVEVIEKTLEKTALKDVQPMQPGDVLQTFADIQKSRKILNYHPCVDFEDGISRFVEWYLRRSGNSNE